MSLLELGQRALQGRTVQEVGAELGRLVERALDVELVAVLVREDAGPWQTAVLTGGDAAVDGPVAAALAALAPPVIAEGHPVEVDLDDAVEADSALRGNGFVTALVAPIELPAGLEGVLLVCSRRRRSFGDDEVAYLTAMGRAITEATRRGRTEAALQERVKEQTAVASIARAVVPHPLLEELLRMAVDALRPSLQFPDVTIVELEIDGERARGGAGDLEVSIESPVVVDGVVRGSVRLGYRQAQPFLDEEYALAQTVAELLASWVLVEDAQVSRRHSEQRVAMSEERLARVLQTMGEAVLIFDRSRTVTYANHAAERLFGVSRDELIGWSNTDPGWGVLRDAIGRPLEESERPVWRVLTTGERIEGFVMMGTHRDGHPIAWSTNASPLRDVAGEIDGVILTLRDVREQVEADRALRAALERETEAAEELRELNQMKDGFLQAVSHELRTPLTAVLGFSVLLRRHGEMSSEQIDQVIGRLEHSARRLETLLSDLLDIDRLTRGTLSARRAPTRVRDLVLRTLTELDGPVDRVRVEVAPEIVADIDGPRTERIVENLVANALRHTDGPITVTAERGGGPPPESGLLLSVLDRGPGIPERQRQAVFDPFRQGDTPAARVGGAGIGLALVRTFAELHGGRAWVDDNPDGGSIFRVLLPGEVSSEPPG